MVASRVQQALDRARGLAGEVTGTLTQDGADTAFTGGRIVRRRRRAAENNKDELEVDLELVASGIAVEPRTDARVVLTGDSTVWGVKSADPIAPGGTEIAWSLTLRTWIARRGE